MSVLPRGTGHRDDDLLSEEDGQLGMRNPRMVAQNALRLLLNSLGLGLVRKEALVDLREDSRIAKDFKLLLAMSNTHDVKDALRHHPHSKSQLRQDLFALTFGNSPSGFFVEFGAADGVSLSNTHLLETQLGWTGILSEPARGWHNALENNRQCIIDKRCVWSNTGERISFKEVEVGELSTVESFSGSDGHAKDRRQGITYEVETVSLLDLLREHHAPKIIDYLSIDTEGSEFEILRAFDFSEFSFRVITVEHNFTPMREKIHQLLTRNGYRRVLEEFSEWDDWYLPNE
jgi:FkbM family methyltransferase